MTEEMASNAPKGELRWYVIQAFSGYEQRVAECLQQQIELQGMKDYFGEVLVPKEKVKEIRDGKKVESERKLFPGYVLVQMIMNEKSWLLVRHTDRVLGFVGGTIDKPMPITAQEADRIMDRLKETEEAPRPKTVFEIGEVVRACEVTDSETYLSLYVRVELPKYNSRRNNIYDNIEFTGKEVK